MGMLLVLFSFVLWGPWISVQNIMSIHPLVEIFQSGPTSWTNRLTIIAIHRSMPQAMLKTIKNISVSHAVPLGDMVTLHCMNMGAIVYFESNAYVIVVLLIVSGAPNMY